MRRLALLILFVFVLGREGSLPPETPRSEPPPDQVERAVRVTVRGADSVALAKASGILTPDTGKPAAGTNVGGRLTFMTTATGGGWLTLGAEGYQPKHVRLLLDENLEDVALEPEARIGRLRVEGRRFVDENGQVWPWRGITAFRLAHMVASGEEAAADAYFAWAAAHDITIVRVLAMAWNLFRLTPADGVAALPRLFQLATRHGIHVEVVALADTQFYEFDIREHVRRIGAECTKVVVCLVEIANELDPLHGTQDPRLSDVAFIMDLRRLVPSDVLVALGSSHGAAADDSTRFAGGDFVTVHEDREGGVDGWGWVRQRNDTRDLAERIGKPLVGDEPKRDNLSPDRHLAFALLAGIFGLGDTFHYADGLYAKIPTSAELAAFEGRRRGWLAVPASWHGTYQNTGLAGSPVAAADWSTVFKVFSSVGTTTGYTVALGVRGDPRLDWAPGWPERELLISEGGLRFWQVRR